MNIGQKGRQIISWPGAADRPAGDLFVISINYEAPAPIGYFCLFLCQGHNHNSLHTALYSVLKI